MIFANDDFDINAEVVFVSNDLGHSTARLLRCSRPVGYLDIDHNIFQIGPVISARHFFTKNAVLGRSRRRSSVVGRSPTSVV
jgi:hypothetical protein